MKIVKKIVAENRRKTSFKKALFERGFPTILGYDFIFTIVTQNRSKIVAFFLLRLWALLWDKQSYFIYVEL